MKSLREIGVRSFHAASAAQLAARAFLRSAGTLASSGISSFYARLTGVMVDSNMPSANAPATPEEYIAQLEEPRRSQIQAIYDLVREAAPDLEPWMVSGKIGFGRFPYRGKSKACQGEWFKIGLASNKNTIMFATCARL